jgi:hypothetical protein
MSEIKLGPHYDERLRSLRSELTAEERARFARDRISELSPLITSDDVQAAVKEISEKVSERYGQKREKRPGFAVLVFRRADLAHIDSAVGYDQALDMAVADIAVEPDAWGTQEQDGCKWSAFRQAVIAAKTGYDSGTIQLSNPADPDAVTRLLDALPGAPDDNIPSPLEEHLFISSNLPGAILTDGLVFSVAGLYPENNREIAEAIAVYAFCAADERKTPGVDIEEYNPWQAAT